MRHPAFWAVPLLAASLALAPPPAPPGDYVKKATRPESAQATLAAFGLPNLEGEWLFAGPFPSDDGAGFFAEYPPEKGFDRAAAFVGKDGRRFGWRPATGFRPGKVVDLKPIVGEDQDACVYLYTEFTSPAEVHLPVSFGSDDSLSVWKNGKRVVHENQQRAAEPDQYLTRLILAPGKNSLLLKVCQFKGDWAVYVAPGLPESIPETVRRRLDRDFPPAAVAQAAGNVAGAEAPYYPLTTLREPDGVSLEVGGLAFRPDGSLLVCTRRGEIWRIENPGSDDPSTIRWSRWATGLHEALGMHVVDDHTVYVVQRPELTLVKDANRDGVADDYTTACDQWGVSGDYHEYAFGPALGADGKFAVTLNVGFGGGHQAKAAWRGWCVTIDPKSGALEPFAYGLRSPNGVHYSPDGELFYCDNQGEWVATNKMHHLKRGRFYGHQASLKWLPESAFKGQSDKVDPNLRYDGEPTAKGRKGGFPDVEPPCIWFPYGKMGQSATEPKWDTTAGKFGPFAGQAFVGDQTRSVVMRVALEKVNGVYQGACFPFRSGLQCGVNRLAFGPDGALYAGQTSRGWGSVGGKPFGLQRIEFAGQAPFDIHRVELTRDGFDLHLTKPASDETLATKEAVSVTSFTYVYASQYGCPETDTRPEPVTAVLADGGKTLRLTGPKLAKGRVYEVRLGGAKSADGEAMLHPEAYYTLNELVK